MAVSKFGLFSTKTALADRHHEPTEIVVGLARRVALSPLPPELLDRVVVEDTRLVLRSLAPVADLHVLCAWILEQQLDVEGVQVRQPTLEDTYLRLTSGAVR